MRRLPVALLLAAAIGATSPPVAAQPSPTSRPEREQAPPPTPVPPFGSPSPFPTTLATPADSTAPPVLSAAAWALVEMDDSEELLIR
ncbi:MAG: hypothetical protein ACRDH6_01760, partial [Actinomycetota bacterium]